MARSSSSSKNSDIENDKNQFITNKRCPYAQKAWIALEASQCPYQLREVSLYGPGGKPDWFWKLNPSGTVPILVKEGRVFADSELILDALGDHGRGGNTGLLGSGGDDDISKWRRTISKSLIPVGKAAVLSGSRSSEEKLRNLLKELNDMVVGPYLVGDQFTLADCAAFPFLWRIDNEFGIGNEGEEKLRAWLDKCIKTEAVQKTIPSQGWWWWW